MPLQKKIQDYKMYFIYPNGFYESKLSISIF